MPDKEIAIRYEAITNPANLPLPEEVISLCISSDARRRILRHAEAINTSCLHNLSPERKITL